MRSGQARFRNHKLHITDGDYRRSFVTQKVVTDALQRWCEHPHISLTN